MSSETDNVVNLMDAWLKKQGISFFFTPSSKGYPAYRDPAADNPVGILPANPSDGEVRRWKNRYAPNEPG